jgi:hypothetical protein
MIFRTDVQIPKSSTNMSHDHTILMLGSCFTENIGQRLLDLKFKVNLNPFGIIFNPASVANSLDRIIAGIPFTERELFVYNDLWHSYLHHSRYSSSNIQTTLSLVNSSLKLASEQITKTDFLILTFGTAWVFRHNADNVIVSNCHKVPASHFTRELLSVSNIVERYKALIAEIKAINPNVNIIFTLSPVRHLKDGAEGNQISKAILGWLLTNYVN